MRARRDRGFTLVELLVSMMLSMVGLLGLMGLQLVAIRGNGASRNFTEATALAQDRLETVQSIQLASLTNLSETNLGATPNAPVAQKIYSRQTTVTFPAAGQANITVDVSWQDPNLTTTTHHVRLFTTRTQ